MARWICQVRILVAFCIIGWTGSEANIAMAKLGKKLLVTIINVKIREQCCHLDLWSMPLGEDVARKKIISLLTLRGHLHFW